MGFRNEIRTEAQIDGTPDEVWAVLSDFGSYGEWNPGMEDVQGRAEVGSRLTIRFLNGGRTMTMKPTVLVAEPGRELRWLGRLLVPWVFDGEHRFEIHETTPDSVTFVQGERFKGLLVPFLRKLIEVDTAGTFAKVNDALARRVVELRTRDAA
ncbi:MAG: SRPBCC family protein [Actinomycetota bacterium]